MEEIRNKKYRTVFENGLYRIYAVADFDDVEKGDMGGLIEKESNLSAEGNCWVYDDAMVYDNARVSDNAKIYNCHKRTHILREYLFSLFNRAEK